MTGSVQGCVACLLLLLSLAARARTDVLTINATTIRVDVDASTGSVVALHSLSLDQGGEDQAPLLSVASSGMHVVGLPGDRRLLGAPTVAYCPSPSSSSRAAAQASVCVTRRWVVRSVLTGVQHNVTVREALSPLPPSAGGGVEWLVSVANSTGAPFRSEIITGLALVPTDPGAGFAHWTPRAGANATENVLPMRPRTAASPPLRLQLGEGYLYGGAGAGREVQPYALSVFASPAAAAGLLVAHCPDDPTLAATLDVTGAGNHSFARLYNRLDGAAGAAVPTFRTLLAGTRGSDFRDGLAAASRWSLARYLAPVVADGPASAVGLGLYTCEAASGLNRSFLAAAGASVNWDAHFWWPYIGFTLPPAANATWPTNKGGSEEGTCGAFHHGQPATVAAIRAANRAMAASNLTVLAYFNLFEFGQDVVWPLPAAPNPRDWLNSSVYLAAHLRSAIYGGPSARPSYTWQQAVVLDPGEPAFGDFLLDQAAKHASYLGDDFHGITIDRTDHTRLFNMAGEDAVSWCGSPCRSALLSWLDLCARVAAVVHGGEGGRGRTVLINYAGSTRLELLRHADGLFTEGGTGLVNPAGLSTLGGSPAVVWTYSDADLLTHPGGIPGFMAQHLLMGCSPMAPSAGADHSIGAGASPAVVAAYVAHGPLFRLLRGARWLLAPDAVSVPAGSASANAFLSGAQVLVVLAGSDPEGGGPVVFDLAPGPLLMPAAVPCNLHRANGSDRPTSTITLRQAAAPGHFEGTVDLSGAEATVIGCPVRQA